MYVHASYSYGVHYFIPIILITTSIATMNLPKMYITVSTNRKVLKAYPTNMMVTFGTFRDLNSVSLQSGMSINSLVNRATNSYVAKHDKEYKYCISPDCPSIYRVTLRSDVFCCFSGSELFLIIQSW
jgi:hypothetical protein